MRGSAFFCTIGTVKNYAQISLPTMVLADWRSAIGNPVTYDGRVFTWKVGRQLHSITSEAENLNAAFTYNQAGLRVKKTVNGMDTIYTYNGKKIMHMKQGENEVHFFYDAQGKAAIAEHNGTKYGYRYNLQGDVIALIDAAGESVVEYKYDAWGKPLGKTGSLKDTLGTLNPFRYRGYVYDEETGLYYLRSRYYNAEWMRFVNADIILGTVSKIKSHNCYEYCYSAPTVYCDSNGTQPMWYWKKPNHRLCLLSQSIILELQN